MEVDVASLEEGKESAYLLVVGDVFYKGNEGVPHGHVVTVEGPPIPFSPFSLADCTLLNHFSFEDFVAVAFPDIAGDLDIQI